MQEKVWKEREHYMNSLLIWPWLSLSDGLLWRYHVSEARFSPFQDYSAKGTGRNNWFNCLVLPLFKAFLHGDNFSECLYHCKSGWVLRFTAMRSAGRVGAWGERRSDHTCVGCGHHMNRIDCYAGSCHCFFIIQCVSSSRETLLIVRNVDKITILLTKWDSIKFYNTVTQILEASSFCFNM